MFGIFTMKFQFAIFTSCDIYITIESYINCLVSFSDFPWIFNSKPLIWNFYLFIVFDELFEQTILISDGITRARIVQSSQGIKKTCSKSSQTTITKSCICFYIFQIFNINTQIIKSIFYYIIDFK